jgi:hypothetical protein
MHFEGSGPPRTQLTRHRVGYDLDKFDAWLTARTFASRAAALAADAANIVPARPKKASPHLTGKKKRNKPSG